MDETQGKLQSRTLLVNLEISFWMGTRLDKSETRDVANKHSVKPKVARVTKSLMPTSTELKKVKEHARKMRDYVYKNSLPWGTDLRVISTDNYMQFSADMANLIYKYDALCQEFVQQYYVLIDKAKLDLNTLFKSEDYPSNIEKRFKAKCDYTQMPDSDNWVLKLSDEHVDGLKRALQADVEKRMAETMRTAWKQLYDVATHLSDRLGDPKAVFYDSTIENAKHVIKVLKHLNFTNDRDLEDMRYQLDKALALKTPSKLRKDVKLRQSTATDVKKVMDKMSAFM